MEQTLFCALAETYRDMVYRIALNFHRNMQDAEDTMQEVLLKLYLRKEPFDSQLHARNWLIQVTLNQCRSVWRNPWRKVSLEELSAAIPFTAPEESELFMCVMALPEKHRTAIYLFYYEELSVREIAELLHISETAVTSRLSRARKELKKEWTEAMTHGV
ncbi:MAG: sigma-70 family RNA polymerase sigma factor [Clostridiales bacterium]|nr:sigma-70 family RNA polymerase sigma factor [Clostridiales bacterium]